MPRASLPVIVLAVAACSLVLAAVRPDPVVPSDPLGTEATAPENVAEFARLDAVSAGVRERNAIKEVLVLALIDGQVSLSDVVAEFVRLNAECGLTRVVADQFPGATDEERTARNVLYWATRRVSASQGSAVMGRLEREFDAQFGFSAAGSPQVP